MDAFLYIIYSFMQLFLLKNNLTSLLFLKENHH